MQWQVSCIFYSGGVKKKMENRDYYRIQDVLPILVRKIDKETQNIKSRVIAGFMLSPTEIRPEEGESAVDPKVWSLLVEMDTKLNLVLEKLNLEFEGMGKAETKPINLSEGGMRFNANEKYEIGDLLEIKLLLHHCPFSAIALYGTVVRVGPLSPQEYEVGITFLEMEDDVHEILWRYILDRQRGMVRRQRERKMDEEPAA
jgi:Tfp pilus assembly protein PilZ